MGKSERRDFSKQFNSNPGPGNYDIKAFTDVIYENHLKKSHNSNRKVRQQSSDQKSQEK